jgi:two-component system response regulator YesN
MYRMLIVEDFFYDREEAKTIINWQDFNIEIVGAVENGIEALESIPMCQPDIVFTDIEMPRMDGMELTQRIKQQYPSIKIVFMSCHSEFEYARNALKLDVSAYITKPFMQQEVSEVFHQLCNEITSEREREQKRKMLEEKASKSEYLMREQLFRRTLLDTYDENIDLEEAFQVVGISETKTLFQVLVLETDTPDGEGHLSGHGQIQPMDKWIYQLVSQYKREGLFQWEVVPIQMSEIRFALIMLYDYSLTAQQGKSNGYKIAEMIKQYLACSQMGSLTIAIGNVFREITQLNQQYERCLSAIKQRFFLGKGQIIDIKDVPVQTENININSDKLKVRLRNLIFSGNIPDIQKLMDESLRFINRGFTESSVRNYFLAMIINAKLLLEDNGINIQETEGKIPDCWESISKLQTLEEIIECMTGFFIKLQTFIIDNKRDKNAQVIKAVKDFIEEHYWQDITLSAIANEMYFSPNYINTLFKEETGDTIPEYKTKVRINKAKEYLKDPSLKLYEIVEKVGYKQTPYLPVWLSIVWPKDYYTIDEG